MLLLALLLSIGFGLDIKQLKVEVFNGNIASFRSSLFTNILVALSLLLVGAPLVIFGSHAVLTDDTQTRNKSKVLIWGWIIFGTGAFLRNYSVVSVVHLISDGFMLIGTSLMVYSIYFFRLRKLKAQQ